MCSIYCICSILWRFYIHVALFQWKLSVHWGGRFWQQGLHVTVHREATGCWQFFFWELQQKIGKNKSTNLSVFLNFMLRWSKVGFCLYCTKQPRDQNKHVNFSSARRPQNKLQARLGRWSGPNADKNWHFLLSQLGWCRQKSDINIFSLERWG